MSKLEFIISAGAKIAARDDQPLAVTAWEVLDRLCDEWGYPRYAEIGRYQGSIGSISRDRTTYSIRDKETGVVVRGEGKDGDSARRDGLYTMRQALGKSQMEICWPKGESVHSPMCTCKNNSKRDSNLAIGNWKDPEFADDFEELLGYSSEQIAKMGLPPAPGPLSRPSSLAG